MEDPDPKAPNPVRISRMHEAGRLERQYIGDAYERLMPIIRRVCGERDPCAGGWPAGERRGVTVERKGASA